MTILKNFPNFEAKSYHHCVFTVSVSIEKHRLFSQCFRCLENIFSPGKGENVVCFKLNL